MICLIMTMGCSLIPSDKMLEQLSQNERSWCISISSVYGVLKMGGTGAQSKKMSCTTEGLTVFPEMIENQVTK